jgi:hypothetical protein
MARSTPGLLQWLLPICVAVCLAPLAAYSSDNQPSKDVAASTQVQKKVPFVLNDFWTTNLGPAAANILLQNENFVGCIGGSYALCYYSGPEPETCKLSADGQSATCKCFEIPHGVYFVDINAISNFEVYLETVRVCGQDGSACWKTTQDGDVPLLNKAPVCSSINQGKLVPGADSISTFSFDCVPTNGIGQTNCPKSVYAGCMTAPCKSTDVEGIAECDCPTFNGAYQIGQNDKQDQCILGSNLVWSAAFNPNGTSSPTLPTCIPDAPGGYGCPLWTEGTVIPPDSGVDCSEVCNEYASCQNQGIETGFTCDATLCTSECNDRDLVGQACSGLGTCEISEIIKAETAAGCSCCASQLCNCEPNTATNAQITVLNELQRSRGIAPQCDQNGTLCGAEP